MRRTCLALLALAASAPAALAGDEPPPEATDIAKIVGIARVDHVHLDAGALRVEGGKVTATDVTGTVAGADGRPGRARFGAITVTGARPDGEAEGRAYDLVEIADADLAGRRIGRVTVVGLRWSRQGIAFEGAQAEALGRDAGPGTLADAARLTPRGWASGAPSRFDLQVRGLHTTSLDVALSGAPGYAGALDFDVTAGYDASAGAMSPESATLWIGKLGTVALSARGLSFATGGAGPAAALAAGGAIDRVATASPASGLSLAKDGSASVVLTDAGLAGAVKAWLGRTAGVPAAAAPIVLGALVEQRLPATVHPAFRAMVGTGIRQFLTAPGSLSARFAGSLAGAPPGTVPVLAKGQPGGPAGSVAANRPAAP